LKYPPPFCDELDVALKTLSLLSRCAIGGVSINRRCADLTVESNCCWVCSRTTFEYLVWGHWYGSGGSRRGEFELEDIVRASRPLVYEEAVDDVEDVEEMEDIEETEEECLWDLYVGSMIIEWILMF
jgi:hypothetical protein